jgi:hypothetical protein
VLIRLLHILVAFNLLASSAGIVISKHYCGGELKNTAFYKEAESCHKSSMSVKCPMHSQQTADSDDNCCQNSTERYAEEGSYVGVMTTDFSDIEVFVANCPTDFIFFSFDSHPTTYLFLPPKIPPTPAGIDLCRRLDRWRC